MKKKLFIMVVLVCICIGLCSCNNERKIDTHLQEGEYIEAYKEAKTSKIKEKIVAENLLAYACYDIALNIDSEINLISGSFGQAKASVDDTYIPNDSIYAIDNYEKLAEYVCMLSGKDVLEEYYYGVLELKVENNTKYCLVSIGIDSKTYKLKYVWDTLEQTTDSEGIVEDFYKYIARYIDRNETSIDIKAVERINKMYLSDSPKRVEFEFDLRKQ